MFLYFFFFIHGFLSELEKGAFVCTSCQTVLMREKFVYLLCLSESFPYASYLSPAEFCVTLSGDCRFQPTGVLFGVQANKY